jgi:hypothetical protein
LNVIAPSWNRERREPAPTLRRLVSCRERNESEAFVRQKPRSGFCAAPTLSVTTIQGARNLYIALRHFAHSRTAGAVGEKGKDSSVVVERMFNGRERVTMR